MDKLIIGLYLDYAYEKKYFWYAHIYISKIHKTDAHLFNYMLIHLSRVLLDS